MIVNSPLDEPRTEPFDALDRLLSDYFKAQLKEPWPTAPSPLGSEPSTIVTERLAAVEVPHNHQPTRDHIARARYTLAALVLLLLGTCWSLSTGFQAGNRGAPTVPEPGGMLGGAGASKPPVLEELRKDAAIKGETVPPRPPMNLP